MKTSRHSTAKSLVKEDHEIVDLGKYKLKKGKVLGYGSFSKVYAGKDNKGLEVCIKEVKKHDKKKMHLKIAIQQAQILQSLSHPNISQVFETVDNSQHFYIVSKLYNGVNLGQLLDMKTKLDYKQAQSILTQLIDGLEYLHKKKVMHRDLKPDNIMITRKKSERSSEVLTTQSSVSSYKSSKESQESKVVLIDFGFATKLKNGEQTVLKDSIGTPSYMAPEVLGNSKYTSKADIWSVGVIAFRMFYGKLPWSGKTEKQLFQKIHNQKLKLYNLKNSHMTEVLRSILAGCLQVDPEKRISWKELFILNNYLKNGNLYMDSPDSFVQGCECSMFGVF